MSDAMNNVNATMVERYRNNFLKEVTANVEEGDWVKMCMQCGVCAGSCPLGNAWDHPPQEIFMMIRAGKREEVLTSDSMWMCTSCYNCIVRCPREIPITHIMHGLANYAHRLGIAPKMNPTRRFAKIFWNNITKSGRVNELTLSIRLYFMDGLVSGIKMGMNMMGVGMGLIMAGRLDPMGLMSHSGVKDTKGMHAMLKKAREIEDKRKGFTS